MGDDALENLARVQAAEEASHEEALSRALGEEQAASEQLRHAQAVHRHAEQTAAHLKEALLETAPVSAEDLVRRADDFILSRSRLDQASQDALEAEATLRDAEAETRGKRRAWAEAKSRQKALSEKRSQTDRRKQERREAREED